MRNYSNMKKNKINDICFKLYAPELCDSPVTESKRALENKLFTQMVKYGAYILKIKAGECYENEKEESINIAAAVCINKWREKEITVEENFSAYFTVVLKNEYGNIIKKEKKEHCISLDKPVGDDEDDVLCDRRADEKSLPAEKVYEEKESAVMVLRNLDICWKQAKFPDWYRTVITGELYEYLHEIFCRYEINPECYSFTDMEIYNLEEKPKKKDIAEKLGKNPSQISRAEVLEKLKVKLKALGLASPL